LEVTLLTDENNTQVDKPARSERPLVMVRPEEFDRKVMTLPSETRRELGIKLNPLVILEQMMVQGMLDVHQAIDVCKHLSKFTHSPASMRLRKKQVAGSNDPEDWVRAMEEAGVTFDNDTGEIVHPV
jgi:hypothetical protein